MIARTRGGWRTIIADLALILFMVTASQLSHRASRSPPGEMPASAEPSAIFRPDKSAPSFSRWLAEQAPDDRQNLTIVSQYTDGNAQKAFDAARVLAEEAGLAGRASRIIIEPAAVADSFAILAYDRSATWHAGCTNLARAADVRAEAKDQSCD